MNPRKYLRGKGIALGLIFISLFTTQALFAQVAAGHAAQIRLQMERLNVLGSALYFAAHPDDENTKLIAYLSAERKVRTAYFSLTRGDGGQNLIGTEQGIELGLIRTQELLQARRMDGGEQYFSSAFDFGFSKTFAETFSFWNKQEILREAVWMIRKLQPDIIIARFPPDPRAGHGHHQASAIIAQEAFVAAADPTKFPEQLDKVHPWQAKRLLWNTASFFRMQGDDKDRLRIDIGQYNPLLGQSYGEIAALGRSQHKSQGFGTAGSNGISLEVFEHVKGEEAQEDLFDDVDLSWNRVPHSEGVALAIQELLKTYDADKPQASIPQLANIWHEIQKLDDGYWKTRKSEEVRALLLACAGIKVESITAAAQVAKGNAIPFQTEIIVRNPGVHVELLSINEQQIAQELPSNEMTTFEQNLSSSSLTQPYWLVEPHSLGKFQVVQKDFGFATNQELPAADIRLKIEDVPLQISAPIQYRYVDPVRGEVHEFVEVVPPVSAQADVTNLLVQKGEQKNIQLVFQRNDQNIDQAQVTVAPSAQGWKISPEQFEIAFAEGENTCTKTIQVSPLEATKPVQLQFTINGEKVKAIREISYEHIYKQAWFPDVSVKLTPISLVNPIKRVGYIMGAGDLVPEALRNIGTKVDILELNKLNQESLEAYDAIVFGIRALNIYPKINEILPSIYDYVHDGGVVLMQYNVNSRLQEDYFKNKPAPFHISADRVTEEDASVEFTDPNDPVLNYPNVITAADFADWVQERGLYFAEEIDSSYRTPLRMHDKNEPAHRGALLIKKMGKGKFVYTSLSFFRQLPAGVAGANRLFVNLLAKEK